MSQDIYFGELVMEEVWAIIEEFPYYRVSSEGRIYNDRFQRLMRTSKTYEGNVKITLTAINGERLTRSVAVLVADAFIFPPNELCTQVICLDGNLENVRAENLQWRPTGFAWKYTRQLREPQPHYIYNLPVVDLTTGVEYESIYDAGMAEGLLFEDIWRSTHAGSRVFPNSSIFEVIR